MIIKHILHNKLFYSIIFLSYANAQAANLTISAAINNDAPSALQQTAESIKEATKKTEKSLKEMLKKFTESQSSTASITEESLNKTIIEADHTKATRDKEKDDKEKKEALDKEYAEICKKNTSKGFSCTKKGLEDSMSAINGFLMSNPAHIPTEAELRAISGVSLPFIEELVFQQDKCRVEKVLDIKDKTDQASDAAVGSELNQSQKDAINNTNPNKTLEDKVESQAVSSKTYIQVDLMSAQAKEDFLQNVKIKYTSLSGNISMTYSMPNKSDGEHSDNYSYSNPAHYQTAIDFKNNILNRESIPNTHLTSDSPYERVKFNSKHAALSVAENSILKMIARRTPPSIFSIINKIEEDKIPYKDRVELMRSTTPKSKKNYQAIVDEMGKNNTPNFSSLSLRYKNAADFTERATEFSTLSNEAKLKEIYTIQSAANQLTLSKIESMERIEMLLAALLSSEINFKSN